MADEVASLRTTLIRTVRTATTEADRRLETRVAVDTACTVAMKAGGAAIAGRLRDLSTRGATIEIATLGSIAVGHLGQVMLPQAGNARSQFEIRSTVSPGYMHVRFIEGSEDAGFAAAIARLMQGSGPASLVA